MRTALTGGSVLVAGKWRHHTTLVMEGERIHALLPPRVAIEADETIDISGMKLVPGFIDTQVNGGGGVMLNDDLTVEGVARIAAAHRQYGTTGLLPTLISDDLDKVAKAIEVVDAAMEADVPGILGIHIEGPFLNRDKKGIHDAAKFRQIDAAAIDMLTELKHGVVVVTLAPECTTPDTVEEMTRRGLIVCAGHTNATYEEAHTAVKAGLRGFTHLYNAMSPLTGRAPGAVGAALDSRMTFAGIIADGFHVHPASLRAALYAKGADQLMLVTDAMQCVGAKDKDFTLQGQRITVKDGRVSAPDGTLAGSDLDMISAVRNAVDMLGVPLATAVQMASLSPARFLRLENTIGDIRPGLIADLVLLDDADRVRGVWIDGIRHDASENTDDRENTETT
jgi:N-acetylglucosamine-6-phosphate deacetylase